MIGDVPKRSGNTVLCLDVGRSSLPASHPLLLILKFILSDLVQLYCHLHTNGCFLAGQSLLQYSSGMVDTDLQNVTTGRFNGVIRLSSVDTMMLKNDSMTYFLPKLSCSHSCLLLLVIVFLFLSQKILEK